MKKSTQLFIFFITLVFSASAFGAEATLPVKAKIVQCGKRAQLEQACRADDRCCPLYEMARAQDHLQQNPVKVAQGARMR